MLEGLVAWVLNNYLGKYVENLNTDQLSIALLSGQVELENLPLRKDALRHLGLPIEIKAGFIGKVKLQIPVRQIRSAPWVIVIEQLYLVASPLPVLNWNAEVEGLAAQEMKLSQLDAFEAHWHLENEAKENSGYYASSYSSWLSYGTGLITNIVENLQLNIKDVHIRYEDNVSVENAAIAFGVTINSLSAQSCDANWIPGFSQWDSSGSSFKLLEMDKLAVYWTSISPNELYSDMNLSDLTFAMSSTQQKNLNTCYILPPVSAEAKMRRNRSEQPLRNTDTPRIVCDLNLEEVPLLLTDRQYDQMVKCLQGLEDIARYRKYRHYRPPCPVSDDPRAWWLYAISCFYPGGQPAICRPPLTWDLYLCRARENVQYVGIYTKILTTPAVSLSPEEKEIKDKVEWERELQELKVLREIAMRKAAPFQAKAATDNSSAGRSILVRWFPNWMGWYSSSSNDSPRGEAAQLEGEILQALSDSAENNTILKRDAVFGQFNFCLKSGTLSLGTRQEESQYSSPMLEFQFKNLSLNVEMRPRTSSHLIELTLGAIYLRDKITENSLFPVLIGPPGQERNVAAGRNKAYSPRVSLTGTLAKNEENGDHWFYLAYEKKPAKVNFDYRLSIKSKCLDVVYQPRAVRWLTEFLCLPHQKSMTQMRINEMKTRTKKELIKNWEQMLDGREIVRTSWDLELDISAPQIIFVEEFNDPNSIMAVIDFGRMQLHNNINRPESVVTTEPEEVTLKEIDDDEMFVTPCSTPPVSEESDPDTFPIKNDRITETSIHHTLYDRYSVELADLQILVGKVKDNWRYAHNKGTSTLHILDRFNISLQIERRVVHTCDPLYPSLTVSANLPKLVAHFNEAKIAAARTLTQLITSTGLPSPFASPDSDIGQSGFVATGDDDATSSIDTSIEMARLLMLQFTVDHVALEVQSRGRSVAELQVAGVKAAFTKRPMDASITLSVHSLLLVDALQTFGPDFELLVASHKHVGMDSMSGSLRDSEPTSPVSPASPDPSEARQKATSPVALTQALSSLASSPPQFQPHAFHKAASVLDAEALITIDLVLVTGPDPTQIANIQFNNLDIIANQETIVELMGFIRRVFPDFRSQKPTGLVPVATGVTRDSSECLLDGEKIDKPRFGCTEITFDFHRLNVLLLRGIVKDGVIVGKKICTATMSEAKIQATVANEIEVEGSLGGLQVVDLTPEGHMHQKIVSVGRDPVLESLRPLYIVSQSIQEEERKAFSFKVSRSLDCSQGNDTADITIRMASLWYTHSPQFIVEVQSCASEFKQYLANLARSIRSAATDMALGLVHARLSASLYGSALSFSEITSPRKRRRSSSMDQSFSGYSSVRDTVPQTPYSPNEDQNFVINVKLDIVLDSPVVIIPRANNSSEVFVAHLGKITMSNSYPEAQQQPGDADSLQQRLEHYDVEIRDMNLYSLDTKSRRIPGPLGNRSETLYSCETLAKPILYDTILQLSIDREITRSKRRDDDVMNLLLEDDDCDADVNGGVEEESFEFLQINGVVITALKVSLTRAQYEQVLDTMQWLTQSVQPSDIQYNQSKNGFKQAVLSDITEEDSTGVTTLKMDPHVRAKLFPAVLVPKDTETPVNNTVSFKVEFELPVFSIELRGDSPTGEQALVDLSFREFICIYEKCHKYETNIQVSLRSVFMEDLLQPEDAKQRAMVVSSPGEEPPCGWTGVSRSCPDGLSIRTLKKYGSPTRGSLPDHLEAAKIFGMDEGEMTVRLPPRGKFVCPTPPPSPSVKQRAEKNLVLISTLLVDPSAPNFETYYNGVERSTSVDFNCLDLVINVESWVVVLDFFSASPTEVRKDVNTAFMKSQLNEDTKKVEQIAGNAETNVSIRSLTVVLAKPEYDIAKANISNVEITVKTFVSKRKEVEGRLGSMSLLDLTLHGQLYRERFVTSGKQALHFNYVRYVPYEVPDHDAQLKLKMSSVKYVHTKRFVAEIQAFFKHFTQLQAVMRGIRAATSGQVERDELMKLSLNIKVGSPMILLPVSSRSSDLLVGELGKLVVTNCFVNSGDPGTISVVKENSTRKCLLDCMSIDLQNLDLYSGFRSEEVESNEEYFKLGSCVIRKKGGSLLTEKCHLKLQVERNLDNFVCHNVPDMSIHGHLSTLDATLDLTQYRLIHGLLTHNLGEDTERILPSVTPPPITAEGNIRDLWTLSSIKLDLSNVLLRLQLNPDVNLTCFNFIRSRLTIESFSNFSQDVDLVSQEILIRDTRFEGSSPDGCKNVFTNILQPISSTVQRDLVQVEVHCRKRHDHVGFTILLNNIQLMAIFDWWDLVRSFLLENLDASEAGSPSRKVVEGEGDEGRKKRDSTFELKLNITDSEVVLVEDMAQWDTNAVILKSTTVISYRPDNKEKPLSCNLSNCEMFSCILGMEDDTALSIIDPLNLNLDVNKESTLEVHLHLLTVRLSYNDMKMFIRMLNSLPKQFFSTKKELEPEIITSASRRKENVKKLTALGFSSSDCLRALEFCEEKLDDAALWLTQNAAPIRGTLKEQFIKTIEVRANCVSLCIIDDCGDADVPLLELSMSEMNLKQNLVQPSVVLDENALPQGALECVFASDYYNRVLSGWEPVLEPWKCWLLWDNILGLNFNKNRTRFKVESMQVLDVNITTTLLELYQMVKSNWMNDFYSSHTKPALNSPVYRRRSPFVAFELKNETGSPLHFTTFIAEVEKSANKSKSYELNEKWVKVMPGDVVPFTFKGRDKLRHRDTHKTKLHQLGIKVEGWQPVTPVTVDQVGVYFRHAAPEIQHRNQQELPQARIVIDVVLEGSAKKLVTVRSALLVVNKLPDSIEVKLECQIPKGSPTVWAASKVIRVERKEVLAVPLVHSHSLISVRPTGLESMYTFCSPQLLWNLAVHSGECLHEVRACHTHPGSSYRFCAEIKRENYPMDRAAALMGVTGQWTQPAHTITLLPIILIVNLLPIDLNYQIGGQVGRIQAGQEVSLTYVNIEQNVELALCLENFPFSSNVLLPSICTSSFTSRIKMEDTVERKLYLQAVITPNYDAKLRVVISAPYWIFNRTGLPLVFRQEGASTEAAGQFEEHEVARMVAPLLFSFADPDASPTVSVRVGTYVIPAGSPQWCQSFQLQKGIQVRKLRVTLRDGRPDDVFLVGIEVRPGRGKYRSTTIVTISPRFQLHNKSSYQLLFAQKCFTGNGGDAKTQKTCLKAMPECHMPFHWPRLDKEQLLCVSIDDIPDCSWSGGLKIDGNCSMHVNVRDTNGRVYFLRLEIILQGATFFVVFTDADTMPPPIRIDNFSEVTITFAQSCCKEMVHSVARAHSSVPYAWDEPTRDPFLTVMAPGGVCNTYDLNKLGKAAGLTYENFIYIAFSGTFKNTPDPLDVESQQLVLDVINTNQVVLARKRQGQRSQLWCMTTSGQLQHEGSSPPSHPNQPRNSENVLVLDIEGPAPQPSSYSRLVLRRPDPRRRSTQTWRFTDEGRLCCVHHNMCVQAQDGFFGLRAGNAAVLGMPQPVCHQMTENGVPLEQAVCRQRLRPGSGFLTVEIGTDGPTRVLSIRDMKDKQQAFATPDDAQWRSISRNQRPDLITTATSEENNGGGEMQFVVQLTGLGVSLVSRRYAEELVYVRLSGIVGELLVGSSMKRLCASIWDVQVDNQLFEAPVPVVLYVTPQNSRSGDESQNNLPALDFMAEMQPVVNQNAVIIKYLIMKLKKLTLILEERLLLKVLSFIGYNAKDEELVSKDENDHETQKMLMEVSASHSRRYYFGILQLVPDQIRLSMKTVNKLPPHLQAIKRKLGLTLIKFEDAAVDLQPYVRKHIFETAQFLFNSVVKHFKDELMWQAGIILVSTDFLGNPLGLVSDVRQGISGLILEGSVESLLKNVTHGIFNSAAKVSESLSDGLGKVTMDDEHEEMRQKIRQVDGKGKDHLVAGMKGFGFGMLGAFTGIFKQTYEGAANEGVSGLFSGLGKGIVGAVTKPVVGLLDLTSETARAVSDSSRSSSHKVPERTRPPRCVKGHGSLLPRYDLKQSLGQQYLYIINNRNYNEHLVLYESLRSGAEDLRVLVSNQRIRIVTSSSSNNLTTVIECDLSDFEACRTISEKEGSESRHYIEIKMRVSGASSALVYQDPIKKPRVRCDSAEVARFVAEQLNYAKQLYTERLHTLVGDVAGPNGED